MRSGSIQNVIDAVEALHGPVTLYGSDPSEEHGTCFKIAGVPATFSVITQDGRLPTGQYDVQIEGVPPGDYLYTSIVSLESLLNLITRVKGPENQWPGMDGVAR
jgi:hypothetical protein